MHLSSLIDRLLQRSGKCVCPASFGVPARLVYLSQSLKIASVLVEEATRAQVFLYAIFAIYAFPDELIFTSPVLVLAILEAQAGQLLLADDIQQAP